MFDEDEREREQWNNEGGRQVTGHREEFGRMKETKKKEKPEWYLMNKMT